MVTIVASTGGPGALATILKDLPANYALPIVIVQHMSSGFVPSLVNWLGKISPLPVKMVQTGMQPLPGLIYIASGDGHLKLTSDRRFHIDPRPTTTQHMPSGDILLESVARNYGQHAVGVVLTGLGDDGARGLRTMYESGAYTIAQDEATSVVYGMPKAAHEFNGVCQTLALADIASVLIRLSNIKEFIQ